MREEIWAVNQMQLAAFYENHVLPMRKAQNEQDCRTKPQDPPPIHTMRPAEGMPLANEETGYMIYPATQEGLRNGGTRFVLKQAAGTAPTFEMPWERREMEDDLGEWKWITILFALTMALAALLPLCVVWWFLRFQMRQVKRAAAEQKGE